jgi:type I restriction enzyme M protein
MSVSTTVKGIQDIMRKDAGVDGDAQRLSQLVWMLFLKIFEDSEADLEIARDDYQSPVPEALRWRSWAANPEGITGEALLSFVNNTLFPQLKELAVVGRDPRALVVREVFGDANNYMKSGTLLRQVVNKIGEIDFNSSDDRHLFGDIYEQLLKSLQSAGNAGEFYTPRAVTQFMIERLDPKLDEGVFDPACGTGGFLTCALEHMRPQVGSEEDLAVWQNSVRGVEKKQLPHLLCTTNLMLHGIEVPLNVSRGNTLERPLRDYTDKDRVAVIAANPPFGGMEEDGIESNFPATFRTRETADLFLVLIMHLLKKGGRGALVLPDGTLFGEGIKTRIKEKLLSECNLHTIVRLPNGVFAPYTGIKTNLLFFVKGEPTKEVWFYEHPYPSGYKSYSKTKPIRIEEFEPERAWWNNRTESAQAWRVPVEEIIANGYNLDIKNPNAPRPEDADPQALLDAYHDSASALAQVRNRLKAELLSALERTRATEEAVMA